MTILRLDNVGIVVDDLKAAIAFFVELGLELEGETTVEGPWVDSTVGLEGVRSDIAMLRTPDGHNRLELSKFHTPPATASEPNAPVNRLGIGRHPAAPSSQRASPSASPATNSPRPTTNCKR